MIIPTQKSLLGVCPYNQKWVNRQGESCLSSSQANFPFLNVNFWPCFEWKSKLACPAGLRQAGDPSTEVNFFFSRLTGPEKYHLMRFINVCTATGVNIVIKNSLNEVKLFYIFLLLLVFAIFFPLVTSLKRVGLKLNLKISILQTFFSYIRTSNSLNQASLRPFCHRNNNQNR